MADFEVFTGKAAFQLYVTPTWVLLVVSCTHCLQLSISAVSAFVTLQIGVYSMFGDNAIKTQYLQVDLQY